MLGQKNRLTPWPDIKCKLRPVNFKYFFGSEHMGYHVNWQRVSKDEMSICDLSPKKLDISSQFQLTRRFAFKKKLSNDASSESQIENLRDFYRGFVLVGSAAPSLFTLTRLSRLGQLVICRPEQYVLSLNSLWYERLFSRDDMVKLLIHRRYAGKRLSTQPQA